MKKVILVLILGSLVFANSANREKRAFDVTAQKLQQIKDEYNQKLEQHYEKSMSEEEKITRKYRPKIQKLEEEKEKNERAMLEAEGKEIPDRLKNKQEIQDWIEERAKRNAEISNRSDSIGSRLKF
ncbi:MAG: hypothetical protein GX780_05090 [Campylobacteraceae bacterium]|nr:hypothetical protein [Campylobacteraceae bacterium]